MKVTLPLLSCLLAFSVSSKIIELNSTNYLDFSKTLSKKTGNIRTLMIFSDKKAQCPACHEYLMKDFFKISEMYEGKNSNVRFTHLDCAYEFLVCRKFHVHQFPHLVYVKDRDNVYVFSG